MAGGDPNRSQFDVERPGAHLWDRKDRPELAALEKSAAGESAVDPAASYSVRPALGTGTERESREGAAHVS